MCCDDTGHSSMNVLKLCHRLFKRWLYMAEGSLHEKGTCRGASLQSSVLKLRQRYGLSCDNVIIAGHL